MLLLTKVISVVQWRGWGGIFPDVTKVTDISFPMLFKHSRQETRGHLISIFALKFLKNDLKTQMLNFWRVCNVYFKKFFNLPQK